MTKHIAIVGGSCVDIFAASALPLVAHDSNPGTVRIGFGGVGRNIAENLGASWAERNLIAAFGSDPFSTQMLPIRPRRALHTEHSLICPERQAPYYISVNDCNGDMAVAVNDMKICERITPVPLSGELPVLNACDAVMLDANIPEESDRFLVARCRAPLFADAVSTSKAVKLVPRSPSSACD